MSFKDHFSGHAADYSNARPTYPSTLFAWLARQVNSHRLAWDVATGNGQAARGLVEHFSHVHASDASAEQIAAAPSTPSIAYHCEPAERSSLADHSADLITVAQAAHWFDLPGFYAETKRVLGENGLLAMWCYGLSRVSDSIDRQFVDLYEALDQWWPPERAHVESGYRDLPFPFAELSHVPSFALTCQWTCDQYLAYLRSWSAVQRCIQQTGTDPVTDREADFRATWGEPVRTVHWPISLRVGHRPS